MKQQKTYYNFCAGIPNKQGSAVKVHEDGSVDGLWKEKNIHFNSDEEAEKFAADNNYPYFERVFYKDNERWKQPFVLVGEMDNTDSGTEKTK